MSVLVLADFFNNQINGGGESNDAVLISYLKSKELAVNLAHTQTVSQQQLEEATTVVVSNFVFLPLEKKDYIRNHCDYVIYEHDHKYVDTRDPSKYSNFDIPPASLVNIDFYRNARQIVVLSDVCKRVMVKNLNISNVHSIGTSLWSEKKIAFLKQCSKNKTKDIAVIDSSNPTKGRMSAIAFCQKNNLEFDLISSKDPYEFLTMLATYKTLVFIPQVLETFCRLVAEAKMLECKVYTNPKLIGMMSEPYAGMEGVQLINILEQKVDNALAYFYELLAL